jgi:AraC-like DNA-binding protein
MVCPRCIETVGQVFTENGFQVESVKLGEVQVNPKPSPIEMENLSIDLKSKGFELLIDKKTQIVSQVKSEIIKLVHHRQNEILNINLSEHLSRIIGADYSFISNLFSSAEGITIEKFTILQKVEKVKEFLSYGELTISEIAWKTGYSSAAYLSSQFKKVTGMTPGYYKNLKNKERKSLDQVGK